MSPKAPRSRPIWLPSRAVDVFNANGQMAEGIAGIVSDHRMKKSHGYPPVAVGSLASL